MRVIRFLLRWTWWACLLAILFFNLRLYSPTPLAPNQGVLPNEILAQLNANRVAIDAGAPESMQHFFPEGFFFCHALHGLTWVEVALRDSNLRDQAVVESKLAMAAISSRDGTAPFPDSLPPNHGMFYSAWRADLQAGIVLLTEGKDTGELNELRDQCDAIDSALQNSPTPFLASYLGSVWPCDSFPAIHALVIYDHVTQENRYGETVRKWLIDVRDRLDPSTGLVSHTASLPAGRQVRVARATSQVIILRFLADIDAVFASQQYETFRDSFFTTFAGIPCVLEYPPGVDGKGDVDSGPLIFGRSPSGTVLMIAVAQIYGDQECADAVAQAGETVGLPWTTDNRKQYVGGVLPVGDIIVAYSHVARPWITTPQRISGPSHPPSRFWRWKVHAASILFLTPSLLTYLRQRKLNRRALESQAG